MAEFIPTKENITETVTPNVTEVKEQVVGEQVTEQAEAPEVPEQTEQGPGPGDPQYDLWKALSEKKAYTKSYDEFKNKFNSVENVDKLYSKVFENKDYTKTKDDFYNRFFPDLKKNETLSQEPQKPAQIGTTPTSPSQLQSTSTPQGQLQKIQQEPSPIVGQQKPSIDQQPAPELPALEYNDPINLAFKSRKKSGLNFEALVGLDDDNKIQKEIDAARIKSDESQKELLNLGYTSSQIKKIQDDSQYLSDDEERATASSLLQADPAGYENYIAFNKALSNLSEADQNKLRQNFNDHNIGVIGIQPGQEKITYTPSIISKVGLIKPQNQGQLFTSLDNLNDYLKQSVDIIDESDAKSEDKQKSKSSLVEAASTYVYGNTTPEDAKNYLSQKMSGEVELKEPQTVADPSGAVNPITMQPFTTQVTSATFESDPDLDKYEIAAIESKLDPKNEVDSMALDIYKKSIALDDAIKKQSQTIADFRSGDKITDLAVSYYAATNPEIKKVIDSFRDENGRVNRLPNNFVAQLTENFIEDPSVIGSKGYKENNLDLYAKETKNKLYDKYPEYAKDKVAALISQYREDNGYNNFFYNAPTVVDVDESVTRMYKEGLLTKKDVEVYEKSIQPLVMTQIPAISPLQTAGFVERTGKGAIDVLHGGYRTMKSLFSKTGTGKVLMQTDLGYNILSDEMERVNMINDEVIQKLQPNTLHSYIGGTGEFTGMALGLALGGAEFKALGLSLEAAETANLIRAFYGNNYYNAKKLHPGNNAKDLGLTYTSALGNTFIDAFAFKLLPVNKATEGLTRAFKLNTNKLLNGVASGTITEQAAKDSFAKLSGKWALSTMGNAAKSGAVLTGLGAMHELFGKLLGDNHESFVDIGLNAADNLLPNVISSSVVSGFAALGSMNKKISAQDVYDIANNPAFYKDRLNKMEANGADPKLVNDIRQNMDIIVETKTQLNDPEFKDLTEAQKKKYLYLKLQEAVYTRNATSAVDPSIAKKFTEKANDYQKQKDAIINNKDKATEFAREEEQEDLFDEIKAGEEIPDIIQQLKGWQFQIDEAKKTLQSDPNNQKAKEDLDFYTRQMDLFNQDPVAYAEKQKAGIKSELDEALLKGTKKEDLGYDKVLDTYDKLIIQSKLYGEKYKSGISGILRKGETIKQTEPVEEAGAEAPTAGGVLQTPGAEGEVKTTGEEVIPTRTEAEVVQSNEQIFDQLYNDLGKQDKAYVDNLLSKGTSKSDLLADPAFDLSMGENPEIKNQYDTNTKELGSIRAKTGAAVEPTTGAAKEQKIEAGVPAGAEPVSGGGTETAPAVLEPKEGDVVELEPQVKGGLPRRMIFKEGEWKQEVGGKTTNVGEPIKAKAQAEFLKQKGAEAKAEPKPTTPEQIIEVKPGELPTKEIKAEVVEEKPLEAKEESLSDIIKKEEEAARKKQQADKDQAKNDIDLIKSGDQATVDKYFQKSGYKEITGNEADTRLKGKQGVYKSTGASITIKKGKAEVALETATNIANKKIQGLSTNRLNQIGIEFEQKKKEAAKQETKPTAEVPEQEVPKTEAKPEAGSVGVGGEVVVSAKPKPIDEQSIAASQKWIKDLYSLPESTRIQDKNGNVYDIVNGKIRKLTLDKEGNVIDAEIIHTDRDVHKRGAYSNPDFFNEGYKVLPEPSLKETPKAEPTKEVETPEQIKIKEKTKNKLLNFANKHVVQPVVKFSRKLFVADPTESIVDEMNSMGGVNINVNLNEVIKKKGKLNTKSFKRKGIVLKPNVVSITDFNGKPVLLTISDELTTGEIVNPVTGQVLGDLRGGIGFNYSKGNTEFAWAYTSQKVASDVLNAAKEMYKKNPELYPDGIVPVAVVKMGKSAMISNEAVIRQVVQNLTDPKIPEKNKQKAFEVLRGDVKNQLDVVDARINKAKSEGKQPTASDAASSRGYKDVLNLIDNSKGFDDLLNNVNKLNIGTRPLLIDRFTSGKPDVIPSENRMSIDKPATKALMEGFPKSEYKRINLGHLINNLVDPSLADVPDRHIISFVGIDAKADAPVKSKTHPNYPYVLKGKGLGILENTVHVADAMPAAHGNIIDKLITAEESGKPVTNEKIISAGLPSVLNNKIFKNKPLSERTSDYNKLVGYLQLAFPNTHFFTDPKTWEAVLDSKDVKKYLKDGEVVYGLTKDGHIYLNPNYDSLNTPIHEAGHLHIDFLETTNPELFNKGISLVEGTGALKDAIKEYGEDGIAARKEALATLIGNKGETITDAAMRSKFQEWLVAVYKYIQSKFPSLKNLTPEQIADLTLDQFVNGSLRDILGAKEVEAPKGKKGETAQFDKEMPAKKINWEESTEGKGDPTISARNPIVEEAAKNLKEGKITNEEYRATVSENSPITPINRFFDPATEERIKKALSEDKKDKVNTPVENGSIVGLRLDIPAYKNNNTWVVSVHEGNTNAGKAISYTNVARITDVNFGVEPKGALAIAAGVPKTTIGRMFGKWSNIEGNTLEQKGENAKKIVEDIVNDPSWVQVGMNPFRHSYFYDRSSDMGRPIKSAKEVIQVGGLVYAKDVVYGEWTDAAYTVKGLFDAAGKPVQFSKGSPEAQKLAEMKEIVKDLVEDKYSLSEIKDIVTRGINDKSDVTIKLIEDAHAEVTKTGGAGVPPTEKAKTETTGEEPEMTKVANAINDAFVEGRFGTEALDNIMSNLQDTSTVDLYNKTKKQIKSGSLKPVDVREKVLTQKGGTEADQAALIYDLADLKSRESSLMDQMINETDPKEQKNIANQILDVQTQMQENALANRLIGRSASTIFRLRQMIVNREMDLATMEKQYMSSKGIKELSPEQQKEVKAAYNKIKELSAKLKKTQAEIDSLTVDKDRLKAENERLEKIKAEAKQKEKQDRAKKVSDKISASQERINKAKENIRKLRGEAKSGVDPRIALLIGEIAAEKFYQGAVKFSDLVTAVYEEIKDEFTDWTEDDVKRHLLPDVKPEYFDAEKDYSKSEKDLRAKIEEYKKIQSEYAKTIYEWNKGRRSDLNEKKSWGEKLADNIYAWQRFAVLSYPSTMVKLAAVVGHNLVLKPFRLGFQKVIAKVGGAMSEDFSGKMGVYGDPSLKAMGKYYSEFIRNFSAANLREQFSGIDTKEILYGDKFMFDEWSAGKGLLEMPGRAHGYIKSFVKNPEFVFAHEMITTQYINRMAEASKKLEDPNLSEAERTKAQEEYDNYDVTNEDNLLRINKIALEHGKDAILMGDNAVVDKFRNLTKGSGFWSTFLKTEAPIVKIPLNFINRALLTKYGLFQALTGKSWGTKGTQHPSVAKLIYKGTEGLTDAQGQVLSKVIQYGSMGAALFTLGYLNKNNVTVNDDGSIDVNGFNISKNLVHVPEFESFFSGVETAHKYKDENLNWIESFVISDIDILKKNPFMNLLEYGLIGGSIKAMTDKKMKDENKLKIIEDAATNKLINIAVPGFVKQTAQFLDTKEGKGLHPLGEPIKRRPDPEADWGTRFMQSLELSIPGLRSMVPAVPELYSEKEIKEDKTLSQLSDAGVELPDISRRKFKVLADDKHPEGNMTESEKEQFVSTLKKNYNTMLQSMLNSKWKGTNQTTGEVVYAMGTELGKFKGDIKRNTTELQEMTDDVFNKAWNKTYEQYGYEKAPTTEYSWKKIGAEAFSQDELKANNLLAMYKRLNVDFAEIPSVDELETKKPLTKDEYAKFQKVYKNLVKEKLEELAGKEFVQKMKDIEMDEMVEIEGTEGTMIGQLAKKYDEGDEKKVGKKMSLLQKRVNSIMSGSVNEALQILRYQTPPKSWSEN